MSYCYENHKNEVITSEVGTGGLTIPAGGQYDGQREIGVDYFDGSQLADLDEQLSRTLVCCCCGIDVPKSELHLQDGVRVCKTCLNEPF